MTNNKAAARIRSGAAEVCTIAQGIFDKAERKVLLRFVTDAKKLALAISRASGAGHR